MEGLPVLGEVQLQLTHRIHGNRAAGIVQVFYQSDSRDIET